jgi:hypothetical protein
VSKDCLASTLGVELDGISQSFPHANGNAHCGSTPLLPMCRAVFLEHHCHRSVVLLASRTVVPARLVRPGIHVEATWCWAALEHLIEGSVVFEASRKEFAALPPDWLGPVLPHTALYATADVGALGR